MATENPQVVGYVPQPVYERLIEFKDTHGLKSVSQAVTAVLEEYFQLQPASGRPEADSTRIRELEKTVSDHTDQLFALYHQLSAVSQRLEQIETASNATTKRVKSLKPIQPSTKPHNATYGRGEAASIYPGWEPAANVTYVFNRFYALNTDEARAAFADKWIGLCAQSLDTAWVVCYQLLNVIKGKEMYKLPHWMEGNKTYDSFKDYFQHRFKLPFDKWLKLEISHQFVVETCPDILEALLHIGNNSYPARNGLGCSEQAPKDQRVVPSQPIAAEVRAEPYTHSATKLQSVDESGSTSATDSANLLHPSDNQGDSTKIQPLSGKALSQRLGVPTTSFYRYRDKKSESEFAEWSRSKDPDGISWVYSAKSKKFYPGY